MILYLIYLSTPISRTDRLAFVNCQSEVQTFIQKPTGCPTGRYASLQQTDGSHAIRQLVGGRGDCEAALDMSLGETVSSDSALQILVVVANIHMRPKKSSEGIENGWMKC